MPLSGDYEPSPKGQVRDQVDRYVMSGGREGRTLRGRPVVVLTSRGGRSGKLRKTPLMRVEHDGRYALVASAGGSATNPCWYYNLLANPVVDLQDGPVASQLKARELFGDEKVEWSVRADAGHMQAAKSPYTYWNPPRLPTPIQPKARRSRTNQRH
jgi:deazaflavin-dependent oxidoreductase (nitroreductase family)